MLLKLCNLCAHSWFWWVQTTPTVFGRNALPLVTTSCHPCFYFSTCLAFHCWQQHFWICFSHTLIFMLKCVFFSNIGHCIAYVSGYRVIFYALYLIGSVSKLWAHWMGWTLKRGHADKPLECSPVGKKAKDQYITGIIFIWQCLSIH